MAATAGSSELQPAQEDVYRVISDLYQFAFQRDNESARSFLNNLLTTVTSESISDQIRAPTAYPWVSAPKLNSKQQKFQNLDVTGDH